MNTLSAHRAFGSDTDLMAFSVTVIKLAAIIVIIKFSLKFVTGFELQKGLEGGDNADRNERHLRLLQRQRKENLVSQ